MPQKECAFFLGANSKDGFVSLFGDMSTEDNSRIIHMIKSGPGCGKGTLMARTAYAVAYEDDLIEQLFCSSDPGSLDGAIVHNGKLAIWDGTAPHGGVHKPTRQLLKLNSLTQARTHRID